MSTNISTKVIIAEEGTIVPSNNIVNFTGAGVTVTNVGGAATVTIPGPGASTGLVYKGLWDATLNNPLLTSGVGIVGNYYVVSVAGTTNLNGVTDWNIGDWAIFVTNSPDEWVKIDNHDVQAYSTVKDESTTLPQRSILKFAGTGVTATDIAGETVVTIPIQPAYATIQEEGSALTQQPIIDFQGTGVTATNGSGKTIVTIPGNAAPTTYGLFAQIALSTPVTYATGEQTMFGSGVGTLSVPANAFSVGDSFTCKLCGPITCANNQNFRIRVKSNGTVLIDTGTVQLDQATNNVFDIAIDFTVTKIGGAGVAELFANSLFTYNQDSDNKLEGFNNNVINNTTFNTTIPNTLNVTAQWLSNNASNSIRSQNFVLSKVY